MVGTIATKKTLAYFSPTHHIYIFIEISASKVGTLASYVPYVPFLKKTQFNSKLPFKSIQSLK
jgi:hypothetical protein